MLDVFPILDAHLYLAEQIPGFSLKLISHCTSIDRTISVISSDPPSKMAMPDSQRYWLNL